MSLVVNTSAASISASTRSSWSKPDQHTGRVTLKKAGVLYSFPPSALVEVEAEDLKELKDVSLISRSFDTGALVTGAKAKKIARADEEEIASLDGLPEEEASAE